MSDIYKLINCEQYEDLLNVTKKYRELIETNIDTSSLDESTYPEIPKAVYYLPLSIIKSMLTGEVINE